MIGGNNVKTLGGGSDQATTQKAAGTCYQYSCLAVVHRTSTVWLPELYSAYPSAGSHKSLSICFSFSLLSHQVLLSLAYLKPSGRLLPPSRSCCFQKGNSGSTIK